MKIRTSYNHAQDTSIKIEKEPEEKIYVKRKFDAKKETYIYEEVKRNHKQEWKSIIEDINKSINFEESEEK